jgi:hypothetical protein
MNSSPADPDRWHGSIATISMALLGAIALFSIIFMPVISIPFVHHDDYNYFEPIARWGLFAFPLSPGSLAQGRPLQAMIQSLFMPFIQTPADLAPLRMLSIIFLGAGATIYTLLLCRAGLSKVVASCTAIATFCLPGFQFLTVDLAGSPSVMATFLSLVAGLLIEQVEPTRFFQLKNNRRDTWFLFLAFVALFASVETYQVPLMFFLVPTLAIILFHDFAEWKQTRKRVLRNLVLFCFVILSYFLVQRFVVIPLLSQSLLKASAGLKGEYAFTLTANPFEKLSLFVEHLSLQALNLWKIHSLVSLAAIVLTFIAAGAITAAYRFLRAASQKDIWLLCQASITVALLLLLSNTPNLLASGGLFAYRTLYPYGAMVLLLIVWAVDVLTTAVSEAIRQTLLIVIASVLALVGSLAAEANVLNTVVSDNLELSFVRARIAQALPALTHIHFIRPSAKWSFLGLGAFIDEFGTPSSSFPQDAALIVRSLIHNRNNFPAVSGSTADERTIYVSSATVIIDMNELLPAERRPPPIHHEIVQVDVSNAVPGRHTGERALCCEGDIDSFWEVNNGYPQWLKITYSEDRKFSGYDIEAHPSNTDRAPKSWIVEGSQDGKSWTRLDARGNQASWKGNEVKSFEMQNSCDCKYYKFTFTEGNDDVLRIYKLRLF